MPSDRRCLRALSQGLHAESCRLPSEAGGRHGPHRKVQASHRVLSSRQRAWKRLRGQLTYRVRRLVLSHFKWLDFDWAGIVVPEGCLGAFASLQHLRALAPLAVIAAVIVISIAIAGVVWLAFGSRSERPPSCRVALCTPDHICLLPGRVCRYLQGVVVRAYDVDTEQGTSQSFLVADLSIRCYNTARRHNTNGHRLRAHLADWRPSALHADLLYACCKSIGTGNHRSSRTPHASCTPSIDQRCTGGSLQSTAAAGAYWRGPAHPAIERHAPAARSHHDLRVDVGAPLHGQAV